MVCRKSVWVLFLSCILFNQTLKAEFVNGLETFGGTVKDTATWQEYLGSFGSPSVTQNEAATLTGSAAYCTKTETVGIGEIVRVEITDLSNYSANNTIDLCLTGNNLGGIYNDDDHALTVSCIMNSNMTLSIIGQHSYDGGGTTNSWFGSTSPPFTVGVPLILEIERASENMAYYRAYHDSYYSNISSTFLTFSGVPDQLYIRLRTSFGNHSATFDNVQIVPEPMSICLLGLGGLALRRRRRSK